MNTLERRGPRFVDQLIAVPAGNSSLLRYPARSRKHKADYNSHVTEGMELQRTRAKEKVGKGSSS